jgi:DNA-directed RNA polymerase specialized sigma24 family protein
MQVVTIPFGYEELPQASQAAVIPICIAREDEDGRPIAWGWFEAMARIPDRVLGLARRYLCDPWRASELAEGALHQVWHLHGNDFGRWPEWRLYSIATWHARDLRAGSWRQRRGIVAGLDDLERTVRQHILVDPANYGERYQAELDYRALGACLDEEGLGDVREMLDMVRDDATWDEIGERMGRSADAARLRFKRKLTKIAKIMSGRRRLGRQIMHSHFPTAIMATTDDRDTARKIRPTPEGDPGSDPHELSQPEPRGVPGEGDDSGGGLSRGAHEG